MGTGAAGRASGRHAGLAKIDVNARVLGVLLLIEVALVVVFDIAAVADPGAQGCRCTPSTPTP